MGVPWTLLVPRRGRNLKVGPGVKILYMCLMHYYNLLGILLIHMQKLSSSMMAEWKSKEPLCWSQVLDKYLAIKEIMIYFYPALWERF